LNPAVNAPCRVEVPIKITQPPKRGRASQQGDASNKRPEDYEENIFLQNSKCKSTTS
jgi:hypothetical protein